MITEASASSARVWSAPALLAAFSALLEAGGESIRQMLRYDRAAIAHAEWWRLLSGNFVHLGWVHWSFNAASLVLLVLLCPEVLRVQEWVRRVLLVGLGMSLGLYLLAPQLATYVGLSGLIYGLFVLGLGRQAAAKDGIAIACLVFLAARIVWELRFGAPAYEQKWMGGAVVAESHLSGALAALLYGLAFRSFRPVDKGLATAKADGGGITR
jgi:rhomboid family GlyGly-CTERM serine protease